MGRQPMISLDAFQLINTWVDDRREQLISLCARLVEAESVNPPGDTRRAVAVLEDFLSGEGVAFERIARVAAKPNLVAGIDGSAPGRHLVFNGHLDTIPTGDPAAWSVPVHALTRKEGRLYGHGMGNMKGAVAGPALTRGPGVAQGRPSRTRTGRATPIPREGLRPPRWSLRRSRPKRRWPGIARCP